MKRALLIAVLLLVALPLAAQIDPVNGKLTKLPGMLQPGMITREASGIPHIFAFNAPDMHFLNGWVHAQDRLWQMDTLRHIASGTMAELVGTPGLSTDVQLRTFGLRRAAEASLSKLSPEARGALESYAAGVNAYLAMHPQLPPEYSLLEITKLEPWTPADSLAIGKLLAFQLSFDIDDIDRTVALISYQTAGKIVGFDGTKLFFADTWRSAPFSSAATIPDATGTGGKLPLRGNAYDISSIRPETLELAKRFADSARDVQALATAFGADAKAGSNEWAVAPKNTTTGAALLANDPHLALSTPPNFYPISLRAGSTNVAGMGFPGVPFVIQGQNEHIAWGSTVHPMDVTDIYQEQLVPSATSPSGFAAIYKGAPEAVQAIPQVFRANQPGNGKSDDLVVVPASASIPAATLIVPRHGPIIQLDQKTGVALSIQYVGFYPTRELEAFMRIDQATNVDQFREALQYFDVGSQNFAYADTQGNIAYFTSGELPLREDLQAMTVTGAPPFFIRNGGGGNEWIPATGTLPATQSIPYQILPYAEMPQVVNPANGWFVNANNDPIGQTLDNDPLNTPRAGGGLLYLNPGYDGVRAGRITQLMRQKLAAGKVSAEDMKAIQADTVLLDAEVFVPYITAALANAKASGANATLAALGASPAVNAAVARLASWNFTTPTGIVTGYDASDVNGALSAPSQAEIDASVGATIYSAWRSRFLANTMDAVLKALTVPLPPAQQAVAALRYQLENFTTTQGRGASGLNYFNVTGVDDPAARRDIVILKSVADALELLSSDAFAPAFEKSTNLDDYRWGKLHRIVFSHILGNLYSPGAPYGPLPLPSVVTLPGVATDGGLWTVDVANHNARAATPDGFMFTNGPNRRYVGELSAAGVNGQSSLPGGVSGVYNSPWFTNLLMLWLTNDTFPVTADRGPKVPWMR